MSEWVWVFSACSLILVLAAVIYRRGDRDARFVTHEQLSEKLEPFARKDVITAELHAVRADISRMERATERGFTRLETKLDQRPSSGGNGS